MLRNLCYDSYRRYLETESFRIVSISERWYWPISTVAYDSGINIKHSMLCLRVCLVVWSCFFAKIADLIDIASRVCAGLNVYPSYCWVFVLQKISCWIEKTGDNRQLKNQVSTLRQRRHREQASGYSCSSRPKTWDLLRLINSECKGDSRQGNKCCLRGTHETIWNHMPVIYRTWWHLVDRSRISANSDKQKNTNASKQNYYHACGSHSVWYLW